MQKKERRKIVGILLVTVVLALLLVWIDGKDAGTVTKVARNSYGEGERKETYRVTIGDYVEEMEIEIGEREYTAQEIEVVFDQVMEQLEEEILGENQSWDRVEYDLNLVTEAKGYPVSIQWKVTGGEAMDNDGVIAESYADEDGTLVELQGTLQYGEACAYYIRTAKVYPRKREVREALYFALQNQLKGMEEMHRTESMVELPQEVEGNPVVWEKRPQKRGYYVLAFGGICAALTIVQTKEQRKKEWEERRSQLELDYPELLHKFTLLLSTGMTVKMVWERILEDYEGQKAVFGERVVYEEMRHTYHEIQGKIPENEAYERFGQRCELASYLKFGALLSQNLRKGTRGLSNLLEIEAVQALDVRKNQARKKGEEAGTKLLIPMFLMLSIVMIMIIVPAFLTMQG